MKIKTLLFALSLLFVFSAARSQPQVIDNVLAVVGGHVVLKSDVETQYLQFVAQGSKGGPDLKCELFEELLFQKLMLHQAEVDSLEVSENQVESELDRRLRYFIYQIGSQEKLEEYYKKSITDIKNEFRDYIKEQLLVQQVQSKITENIKITPTEVREFFNSIPKDSLPLVSSELEIGHIVRIPHVSDSIKSETRKRLNEMRERIINGEDFGAMAVLYSEDPGSAKKSGELGFTNRGELYPEFEAVAYNLKGNEVSQVIESKAGYHIIQLIERRGERINVRHILIQPKPTVEDIAAAKKYLDSIYSLIDTHQYSFTEAALKFSDDPSKNNNGIIINPQTLTSKFENDDIEPGLFFIVDKMKQGELSKPVPMRTDEGNQAYRLVYLKSRTEPHTANLKDDYDKIQTLALQFKQNRETQKWIDNKLKTTYINILDNAYECVFKNKWIQ